MLKLKTLLKLPPRRSSSTLSLPTVSLSKFISDPHSDPQSCQDLVNALQHLGCVIIKDDRVDHRKNTQFIKLMHEYFSKRSR